METKVQVYYHNKLVGTLAKYDKVYAFQYDSKWIIEGFSISPFSLPLNDNVFIPTKKNFNGLFGVFADSLPDSWGRLLLDRYLKNELNIDNVDELTKLSYLDNKGMGALEYIPKYNKIIKEENIDLDFLQSQANSILDNENINVKQMFHLGGSSGGARPKILANIDNKEYIIKFQSKFDRKNSGLIEYNYALACKKIGIDIPNVKLFNNKYFGIERFDRIEGQKTHIISVAALLEIDYQSPSLDYNDLFKLTKILTNNDNKDIENLYLRMCFNVYAHNQDDHAKNISFLYDEALKRYRLAPAYDMTYSSTYYNEQTMSVNGKGTKIDDIDLIKVGIQAGIKKEKAIMLLDKVKQVVKEELSKYFYSNNRR